jgi:hypothetical protein
VKPDPHGSPIIDYSVEVRGKGTNSFFKIEMCGRKPEDVTCNVPLSILTQKPFNLKNGDQIIVRVSARNIKGNSLHSTFSPSGA